MDALIALGLGIFAPFMISLTISVSRYWTQNYNYKSLDFTIDTFLCMSLLEFGFFLYYEIQIGYQTKDMIFGLTACLF